MNLTKEKAIQQLAVLMRPSWCNWGYNLYLWRCHIMFDGFVEGDYDES
jgi:hypothetical protein